MAKLLQLINYTQVEIMVVFQGSWVPEFLCDSDQDYDGMNLLHVQ